MKAVYVLIVQGTTSLRELLSTVKAVFLSHHVFIISRQSNRRYELIDSHSKKFDKQLAKQRFVEGNPETGSRPYEALSTKTILHSRLFKTSINNFSSPFFLSFHFL